MEAYLQSFITSAVDRKSLSACTLQPFCQQPTCPLFSPESWLVSAPQIITALLRGTNPVNPTWNRVLNFISKCVYNGRLQHDRPPLVLSLSSILPPSYSHLVFVPQRKNSIRFKNVNISFFHYFLNWVKVSNYLTW